MTSLAYKPYTIDELLQTIWEDGPMDHESCDCHKCLTIQTIVSYITQAQAGIF